MAIDLNGSTGISLDDNEKINLGSSNDLQIYHDGTNSYLNNTTGNLTLDASSILNLDSAFSSGTTGGIIRLLDAGTQFGDLYEDSGNFLIASAQVDKDIIFKGNDGGGIITAMTIDMSAGGNVGIGTETPASLATVSSGVNTETRTLLVDNAHSGGSMYNAFGVYVGETDRKVTLSADYGDSIMAFKTNGSERMRIDSSGNVGIGTASPDTKLQIKGAINSSQLILGGTDGRGLKISTTNEGNQNDGSVIFDAQDTEGSAVNSNLIFSSGGTESMRINGNGSKDFGSFESHTGGYNTRFKAGSAASYAVRMDAIGTGSAGVLQVVNGYGQIGSISVSGASTSFNTSSDYRLKTDAQPMTGASARVQALNPVNFEWLSDGNRTDGFLAHEAQEVVPEAVVGVKDAMMDEEYEVTPAVLDEDGNVTTEAVMGTRSVPDYQGIDQSKLVPLLTAALQEALTEIASLKTRVEALEA